MAFPLYARVISNDGCILLPPKSRPSIGGIHVWNGDNPTSSLVVTMCSGKWNSRYLNLLKSNRFCRSLGSRYSNLFSAGNNRTPVHGVDRVIAEVTKCLNHFVFTFMSV